MATDPFKSIIGNTRVLEVLRRMIAADCLPSGLLFVGPEGVGRTTIAEALIRHVVKTENLDTYPDFQRLQLLKDEETGKLKSVVSVEQIGEMRERMTRSSMGGVKAVFIEDADDLDRGAHTLLKTLEEPSGPSLFILRASSTESMPATIASRCQVLRFAPSPISEIALALEKRGLSKSEAEELAVLSGGRPGHALRLLKDGAFRAQTESAAASFTSLQGASIPARLRAVADFLPKDEVNKSSVALERLDAWERLARVNLLQAETGQARLAEILHAIAAARAAILRNGNPQLALEYVVLRV